MNLILYRNESLANVVNKVLGTGTTVTGTAFVLPYDERFPSIRVTGVQSYDNYNYFEIDGKYYYITKVEWKTNQESILHGELDLLMTFKDYIKSLTCYLKRSDNHTTPYINDEMQVLQCNQNYTIVPFEDTMKDDKDHCLYVFVTSQRFYGNLDT